MIDLNESSKEKPTKTAFLPHNKDVEKWKNVISYRIKRVEYIIITILLCQLSATLSTMFSKNIEKPNQHSFPVSEQFLSDFEERIMSKVYERSTEIVLMELDKASMCTQTRQTQPISDPKIRQATHSRESDYQRRDSEMKPYSPVHSSLSGESYTDSNLKEAPLINIDSVVISRRLEQEENHTSCNGTSFHLDLRLDDWPGETSWKLVDEKTNEVIVNQSYSSIESNQWLITNFTMCLVPGPYAFLLDDLWGDGIRCDGFKDGFGSYDIFLDNKLVIEGPKFFGNSLNHSFDSTNPYCVANTMFVVDVNLEANISSDQWHLRNDATHEIIKLELSPEMSTNSSESYFSCLTPGVYIFDTSQVSRLTGSCEIFNDCLSVQVDEKSLFQQRNFSEISTYSFSISNHGSVNERRCHELPILSPLNWITDFQYNHRTEKIMNSIFAVSSSDSLNRYDSFQYKAACWIIFDDELQIDAEDEFLVERYALAVFIYALNLNVELIFTNDTCEFSEVDCNAKGHITKIDLRKLLDNTFMITDCINGRLC